MGRIGRWAALAALAGMLILPFACSRHQNPPTAPHQNAPLVRVRLLAANESVSIRSTLAPSIKTTTESRTLRLNLPPGSDIPVTLIDNRWHIGGVAVPGQGE